jgi:1-acyl-sn-glycerol-3-phosphate acyltransferase
MKQDRETRRQGDREKESPGGRFLSMSPGLLVSLSRLAARLWYATLWCPCWAISQLWFGYRYFGRANVPASGPVLLVANHQSHLDPVLVGLACPRRLKYLARHDLFFWPFNWWIRALGAVPIDRSRGSFGGLKTTLQLLQDEEAVLVFPEGSRTYDGRLQTFHPGFCLLARRSGATIVPVAIQGAFASMPRGSAFPTPCPVTLTFAPAITSEQYQQLSDEQIAQLVKRRIVQQLPNAHGDSKPIPYVVDSPAQSATEAAGSIVA